MTYTIGIDTRKVLDFGIGTYIRNLVVSLAEIDRENRYVLIARRDGPESFPDLPDNFRFVVERSPVYSLRELATLSWRLFRLDLDLYHSTHYVLPAVVPCSVVATIHDIIHLLYPEFLPNRLALLYAQRMIRRTLTRADRVLTGSENTRKDLKEYFQVSGERIDVIYNGVADVYRRRLERTEIERRLATVGIEGPYLLFVGNPKPHKNLDNIVKAYAQAVRQGGFDLPLVCVGGREENEFKVRQRADQLGIGNRIRLLGHVPDDLLPPLYQGAELFLYPTLYEGFGLPVVEAMASGTAVITSNTSALREVAKGHAHLVDPLDVDGISRAIVRCLEDRAYRERLVERGRERAEFFRWQRTAEQTLASYRRVLDPAAPAVRRVVAEAS